MPQPHGSPGSSCTLHWGIGGPCKPCRRSWSWWCGSVGCSACRSARSGRGGHGITSCRTSLRCLVLANANLLLPWGAEMGWNCHYCYLQGMMLPNSLGDDGWQEMNHFRKLNSIAYRASDQIRSLEITATFTINGQVIIYDNSIFWQSFSQTSICPT